MHPHVMAWWHAQGSRSCGGFGGPGRHGHGPGLGFGGGGDGDDAGFGVRRPLRFLAWKLELEEPQIAELAKVLADLKTERAQAAVDHRRATAAFADAVSGDTFDEQKVRGAAAERAESAKRMQEAVAKALARIHAVLDKEQRERLAYLLRTGALVI